MYDKWHITGPLNNSEFERVRCATPDDWEIVADGEADTFHHQSSATLIKPFKLPLSSSNLFFLASGEISGHVKFVKDPSLDGEAKVDLRIDFYDEGREALMGADICLLSLKGVSQGISISSGAPHRLLQSLHFVLVVSLPSRQSPDPRFLPELVVMMPTINVNMDSLANDYVFGTVAIQTIYGDVQVASIVGDDIRISTTHGTIRGSFSASSTLRLATKDGRIDTDIKGINANSEHPTEITLVASNSPIRAKISLESGPPEVRSAFEVNVTTTKAPLDLAYVPALADTSLRMFAKTTDAPILIQLDPLFEGSFGLTTTHKANITVEDVSRADVSDRERERKTEWRSSSVRGATTAFGHTFWEPRLAHSSGDDMEGLISCQTTNGNIHLLV